jgi:hypothetical protein
MHDLLQQIMPILIFGAWIIISIYTANQKRKKKQQRQYEMQQRKEEQVTRPVSEQSRPQDYSCPSDTKDDISSDLKDTLESIFGKMEPQETRESSPYSDVPMDTKPMDTMPMNTTPEDQITEAQLLQEQAALQERASALIHQIDAIKNTDSSDSTEVTFSEDNFELSAKELRKGVIWSEIIGKPVSMR